VKHGRVAGRDFEIEEVAHVRLNEAHARMGRQEPRVARGEIVDYDDMLGPELETTRH
jgi:uncharacterized protein YllA (UPF0747 family)